MHRKQQNGAILREVKNLKGPGPFKAASWLLPNAARALSRASPSF